MTDDTTASLDDVSAPDADDEPTAPELVLTWTESPREAHRLLVHLNDKWALDGRDPDGYTNIGWCFGLHDRPWPERPIFGTVRTMTSRSARAKLDLDEYLRCAHAKDWRKTGLFER